MKFNVKFICDNRNRNDNEKLKYPLKTKEKCDFGFNLINDIRSLYGNISLDEIKDYTSCELLYSYDVILTENEAKETNYFNEVSVIYVYVPEDYLTRYNEILYIPTYKTYNLCFFNLPTKKIEKICVIKKINDKDILEDWFNDGCPLRWGFKNEE